MNEIAAGFCAGIAQTVIGHPLDTIKVLIQNNKSIKKKGLRDLYRGWRYPMIMSTLFNASVFPINQKIYKYTDNHYVSGFISGIVVSPMVYCFDVGKIKQQTTQLLQLRDFYKTPGYFSTTLRESLAISLYFGSYHYCKDQYCMDSFFAGGIAGIANWTLTYPIDVVRSRQIAQNISLMDAYHQKNLWNGFTVCIMRAMIVNASIFKVYDITKRYLDIES
jgi:solute carrier family 25 (mitochondrial carnitine/acylcarnitine transporter), member 20/29